MSFFRKFADSSKELGNIKALAVCAMMLALRVVVGMFANYTLPIMPYVKIGLSFIPIVITAFLHGPVCAAIVSAAGDTLAIILAPTAYPITPGVTLCCIIEGLIYGAVLYRSELRVRDVILAKVLVLILSALPLNTLFLSLLMGIEYPTLLLYRCAVLIPYAAVEVGVILALKKPLLRIRKSI